MKLGRYSTSITALYLFGTVLALIIQSHDFPLFFGLSWSFANIVLLLMIQRLGTAYGITAAILVYGLSLAIRNPSYPEILSLLEIVVVGLILHLTKRNRIIQADAVFWVLLGIPLLFFVQYSAYHRISDELVLTIMVWAGKGLFNALVADILLKYLPGSRFDRPKGKLPEHLTFNEVLFHVMFTAIALPFVIFILINDGNERAASPQFVYLLLLVLGAPVIGRLINRRLLRGLSQLTKMTTDLSGNLQNVPAAQWPESRIYEIRMLIDNFRYISNHLLYLFQDSVKKNQKLLEQTAELQKSEHKLHNLAYYDALTGLPNRLHFLEYTRSLNLDHPEDSHPFAIMFTDLNRFKQVNDTLGHTAGDYLLHSVSERFLQIVSEDCKVFRISGDEFLFILHYHDISDVQKTAQDICRSLEVPFEISGRHLYMSLSLGISVYPYDGNNMDLIMRNADIAMYVAKEQGDGIYHFYDSLIEHQRTEDMQLENELKTALNEGQFTLYYQPKIDASTREVIGTEALIRWLHPDYGTVSPAKFIPLAENSGIILDIDKWVLREACRQNKAWQQQGLPRFPVAVNISARHFYQSNLIPMITGILDETGLEARYIILEITEGTIIRNVEYGVQIMKDLQNMGIRISMDDFGTGYSSLSQLERLPISEMKLDRSFIQGLTSDSRKSSIVRTVIELGHHMELKVVAEGIESPDELKYLADLKCDQFQGYFFSRPLPSEQFFSFVCGWDRASLVPST